LGLERLEERSLLAIDFVSLHPIAIPAAAELGALAVATDAAGDSYVTGSFTGTVDFGGMTLTSQSSADIFVAKYNANSTLLWTTDVAGTGSNTSAGTAVTLHSNDDVYVTGTFRGPVTFDTAPGTTLAAPPGNPSMFLAEYDPNGTFIFATAPTGTGSSQGQSVAIEPTTGSAIVMGTYNGTVSFNLGRSSNTNTLTSAGTNNEMFLVQAEAGDGVAGWADALGTGSGLSAPDQAGGVATDSNGNIYLTGSFTGTANLDPHGSLPFTSSGGSDGFAEKLDRDGNISWAVPISGGGSDRGTGIAASSAGSVYVAGTFQGGVSLGDFSLTGSTTVGSGNTDGFLAKIDTTGTPVWFENVGAGATSLDTTAVALDGSENVYVVGGYQSTGNFNPNSGTVQDLKSQGEGALDAYLLEFDSAGNFVFDKSAGGSGTDFVSSLAVNSTGSVSLAGQTTPPSTFGPIRLLGGAQESFVARMGTGPAIIRGVFGDFDGDGKTDPAVFEPSTSTFYIAASEAGNESIQFGRGTLFGGNPINVSADYDGDGVMDPAVFEPSTATFYIHAATDNVAIQFGIGTNFGGHPVPVPGDYEGDGRIDPAVFEPSTSTFYIARHSASNESVQFGQGTNFGGHPVPIPRDFEGDGKIDPAVFEPSTATFYIARHSAPNEAVQFGQGTNFGGHPVVVPGNYEGDGKIDPAVFEPSTATFDIARHSAPNEAVQFGQGTNFGGHPIVVPGNYEGDGQTDPAVYEPSSSTFSIARHSAPNEAVQFGQGTSFGGNPIAVPALFEGGSALDPAVFEPSSSTFYIARHSAPNEAVQFGQGTNFGGHPVPISAPMSPSYGSIGGFATGDVTVVPDNRVGGPVTTVPVVSSQGRLLRVLTARRNPRLPGPAIHLLFRRGRART
jgi:hypothetical protein